MTEINDNKNQIIELTAIVSLQGVATMGIYLLVCKYLYRTKDGEAFFNKESAV